MATAKQTSAVVERIRGIMEKHGLTVADIAAHLGEKRGTRAAAKGNVARQGKLPPKYMNPATGETWSGHARPPRWIADVKDRTRFLIDNGRGAQTGPRGKSKLAAVAAQTKGKLPPKYRDPKTGATWSGHARPPAWIKNAKDRSQYLI
jgi:DNA-binding protein H-NS